jgi:hypothetical protein
MKYLVKVFEVNLFDQFNILADTEAEAKGKGEEMIQHQGMDLDCFMVEVEPLIQEKQQ